MNNFTSIRASTLSKFLKLVEKKLNLELNTVKAIKDKLNVKNLSVIFPELNTLFPNQPDKIIKINVILKLPSNDPIILRDFNLFFVNNLTILLREENDDEICEMEIVNYLNLMIGTSLKNPNKFYFNEPNLQIH